MTARPDIFLSYNREDQAVAKRYADAFAAEGLNVWWDTALRSGEAYDEVTEAALRGAKAVVVLWSPRSVVSRWVRAEATIADRCKTLVPVTIEPCERPIMFELTQTADLCHWTGDAQDRAWLAFLSDVRRFVGKEPEEIDETPASGYGGVENIIPIVAILPIDTRLSDADEDAAFAADLTDELLIALSNMGLFRILPGAMSPAWQSKMADLRPVARDLNARYVVDGTLRRAGGEFRVAIKLVEGTSGKVLWSQKFNRPLAELGDVPDALASEIAQQTNDKLHWLEFEQAAAKTSNLTAWDHFTRSMKGSIDTTSASLETAIAEGRQAVALAPRFSLAHSTLALALGVSACFFGDRDGAKAVEGRKHVNTALSAEGISGLVLLTAAAANSYLGDPATALRMLERARSLNPNAPGGHFHFAVAYLFSGQLADALNECDLHILTSTSEAMHGWSYVYRSEAHYLAGDIDLAAEAVERSFHFALNGSHCLLWHAALAGVRGADNEAVASLSKLRLIEPKVTIENWLDALARLLMADKAKTAEAQAAFARVWAEVKGEP